MRKLFYLPLEPLPERYTTQLAAAKKGWLESYWIKQGVSYVRIEGEKLTDEIKTGSVLDANGRGYWAISQIQKILSLLDRNEISNEDVIYFDDFWHPGISALPYSFHLTGVRPKMYAMLYAQSVDPFDFTYSMRYWMRDFEKGISKILDGIFVTSTCLRDSLIYAGIGTKESIHVTGLIFNSKEVETYFPPTLPKKKKQVIFSSRWDMEKRPTTFLAIVDAVLKVRKDITFVITTSAKKLRSNNPALLQVLKYYLHKYPDNVFLRENQTKKQYYASLLESKIQINTADQDFVSFTLLEATTCGCIPLYPYFLSFPEALEYKHSYMYQKEDVQDAVTKILKFIDSTETVNLTWVYEKYNKSVERMLNVMKGEKYEALYCN